MTFPSAAAPIGLPRRHVLRPSSLARRARVSVIVPCFNYEDYVAAAVGSALNQEGVDVEVVVVDDRSTDSSREVVRALAAADERVRLVEHAVNRGPVATFNDGLPYVRGEFLVRLDADDLLTPGSLGRSVALLDAVPSVGLVYGHPLHFEQDRPPARTTARRWVVWPGLDWVRDRCRTGVNVITSPEVVMRSSVVDRVGGQRELAHTHDMEMWLRMALVSDVAYIEGADQAWHREHARSLSQRIVGGSGDLVDRRDAFDTLFAWSADFLPATDELHGLAHAALARDAATRVVHMHDRGRLDRELQDELMTFVSDLDDRRPRHRVEAEARRLASGGRPLPGAARFVRAAGRSMQNRWEFARWHRRGTFHRDGA